MKSHITDHSGNHFALNGNILVDIKSPGYDHQFGIYQASFSLIQSKEEPWLHAWVVLPANSGEDELISATHVIPGNYLGEIFQGLGELDLMQHIHLPNWTGNCSMLDHDMYGLLKIRLDINQGCVAFMESCLNLGKGLPFCR